MRATACCKLLPGDLIRQVVGVDGTDRERDAAPARAARAARRVAPAWCVRAGQETGGRRARSRRCSRVLETRGVYASGVLFGPVTIRDALEIGVRGLMVHSRRVRLDRGIAGNREVRPARSGRRRAGARPRNAARHAARRGSAGAASGDADLQEARGRRFAVLLHAAHPAGADLRMIGPQPATRSAEAPLQ